MENREKKAQIAAKETIERAASESKPFLEAMGIDPAIYTRIAFNAILKNPKIALCDAKSLRMALLKCAQLGLVPDGESAVISPFKTTAQVIPMVGGWADLARRAIPGIVLRSRIVYLADTFLHEEGIEAKLAHKPNELSTDRGEEFVRAAYAIAWMPGNSRPEFEVLYKHDLEVNHRSKSNANSGPWITDYEKMCRKSALRQLFKLLPIRTGLRNLGISTDALFDSEPEPAVPIEDSRGPVPEAGPRQTAPLPPNKPAAAPKPTAQPVPQAEQQQPSFDDEF